MAVSRTPVETFAMMERYLSEVAVEMFKGYGIAVDAASDVTSDSRPTMSTTVAIIGYVGDKVRGALVLVASQETVRQWGSLVGDAGDATDVSDTIGEFSNMLLGRLKGRLMTEGLLIQLSTPTAASGSGIKLSRRGSHSAWHRFHAPTWQLSARLDATFDDGFVLRASPHHEVPAEAGDMMLF